MPTVLRIGSYRFHFFSDEGNEPPHIIHVLFERKDCNFWLDPITLANDRSIPIHRLNEIERLIYENKEFFITKYHEHRNRQH